MNATGTFDPRGPSREYRKEQARKRVLDYLKKEGMDNPPEELVKTLQSLKLFEMAGRPNEGVNWLANFNPVRDLPGLIEDTWNMAQEHADAETLRTYADFIALFLLDGKGGFLPGACKSYFRSVYPNCYLNLRASLMKRYAAEAS